MAPMLERNVESNRTAEAESGSSYARYTFCLQRCHYLVNGLNPAVICVSGEPCITIEVWVIEVDDRVAVEDVWNDGLEAVLSESVCQ